MTTIYQYKGNDYHVDTEVSVKFKEDDGSWSNVVLYYPIVDGYVDTYTMYIRRPEDFHEKFEEIDL